MIKQKKFSIFADYFQFYLQDEASSGDLSSAWTDEAVQRMLALCEGVLGVGTARNMEVPVTVQVLDEIPAPDFDPWDHVTECSLKVPSGKIVVAGCSDYFPNAARVKVKPGVYRVRVSYGNLGTVSEDGLDGDDLYRVQLWPQAASELVILKDKRLTHANP